MREVTMAEVNHIEAANEALAATAAVPQQPDPSQVQAHATLALAHATLALVEQMNRGTGNRPGASPGQGSPKSPDLGQIVQAVSVQLEDGVYHLERYENETILVLNTGVPAYERVTKPVLRRINVEKELGVDLNRPSGDEKNTRTLGRDVMRALVEQGKAIPQRRRS
jgi:hypothetical protein